MRPACHLALLGVLAGGCAVLPALGEEAPSEEQGGEAAVLAGDDACSGSGPGSEPSCALNAMQRLRAKTVAAEVAPHELVQEETATPTPVDLYGHLYVKKGKIWSKKTGSPVRLRGVSLFWSQLAPKFWNADALRWLRDDWKIDFIRAPMGIENHAYLEKPGVQKAREEAVIKAAIDLGIYVIVDWHDANADQHVGDARAFFSEMAGRYGRNDHVIFEVFNEPVYQDWLKVIKPYHELVIPEIRQHSDNLIILGTRFWSQEVNRAAWDPVEGENLAYTLHLFAAKEGHGDALRKQVSDALKLGITVFASEWGTCEGDGSGSGKLDLNETQYWQQFFEDHQMWDCNWAIDDRLEGCAALWPGANEAGNWGRCDLTESGSFIRASLRGEAPPPVPTEAECPHSLVKDHAFCSKTGDNCKSTGCCEDPLLTCYAKNPWFAGCRDSCTAGSKYEGDLPEYQTPWTCAILKPEGGEE